MGDKQCIHYWIVDNKDVGRCLHCGAVKDFGTLLRREERNPVRSAAAKERWQDPEYQVKQSAARQSPEYQARQIAARKKRRQEHRAKQNALLV